MMKVSIARRRLEKRSVSGFTDAELRARRRETSLFGNMEVGDIGHKDPTPPGRKTKLMFPLSPEQNSALESIVRSVSANSENIPAGLRRNSNYFVLTLNPSKKETLKFLSAKEVAEILSVSRSSIYRLARNGGIQAYRVGRSLRFNFVQVLDLLASDPRRKSEASDSEE